MWSLLVESVNFNEYGADANCQAQSLATPMILLVPQSSVRLHPHNVQCQVILHTLQIKPNQTVLALQYKHTNLAGVKTRPELALFQVLV